MIPFLKNFYTNTKLLKERNSFENKYNTVLEKYVSEMERKLDLASQLQICKTTCIEQKELIKKLKQEIAVLNEKK